MSVRSNTPELEPATCPMCTQPAARFMRWPGWELVCSSCFDELTQYQLERRQLEYAPGPVIESAHSSRVLRLHWLGSTITICRNSAPGAPRWHTWHYRGVTARWMGPLFMVRARGPR